MCLSFVTDMKQPASALFWRRRKWNAHDCAQVVCKTKPKSRASCLWSFISAQAEDGCVCYCLTDLPSVLSQVMRVSCVCSARIGGRCGSGSGSGQSLCVSRTWPCSMTSSIIQLLFIEAFNLHKPWNSSLWWKIHDTWPDTFLITPLCPLVSLLMLLCWTTERFKNVTVIHYYN